MTKDETLASLRQRRGFGDADPGLSWRIAFL